MLTLDQDLKTRVCTYVKVETICKSYGNMINSTNYARKWKTVSRIARDKYNAIFHDKRANTSAADAALNNNNDNFRSPLSSAYFS